MTDLGRLRAVFDTNVFVAAFLSKNPNSPTLELFTRWRNQEFDLLHCEPIRAEVIRKLLAKGIKQQLIEQLIADLMIRGVNVELKAENIIPLIKTDPQDDVVLACAKVGGATHIVTYDPHFNVLGSEYQGIKIMDGLQFLYLVRRDVKP